MPIYFCEVQCSLTTAVILLVLAFKEHTTEACNIYMHVLLVQLISLLSGYDECESIYVPSISIHINRYGNIMCMHSLG